MQIFYQLFFNYFQYPLRDLNSYTTITSCLLLRQMCLPIPPRGHYDSFLLGFHLIPIKIGLLYSHCLFINSIEANVQLILSTLLAYCYLLWVFKESNFILRFFRPAQCNHTCSIPICREARNSTALKVFLPLLESVGGGLNSLIKPLRAFVGHRETQTPLLQSPIQQFDKGGRFYRPLLLCTHYILSSPIRNRTLLSGLKVLSIHHQCFGGIFAKVEVVLPQGLEP